MTQRPSFKIVNPNKSTQNSAKPGGRTAVKPSAPKPTVPKPKAPGKK